MGISISGNYIDNTKHTAINGNVVKGMAYSGVIIYSAPISEILPTSIALSSSSPLMLAKGNTFQERATINPTNSTNKTLTWASANPSYLTVDQNGLITSKISGGTNIRVTATTVNGLSAYRNVNTT